MGKKIIQFAAILFAAVICLSGVVSAAGAAEQDVIRVGLFYGSSALPGANLLNDVGTGYRFGYLDGGRAVLPGGQHGGERHLRGQDPKRLLRQGGGLGRVL